MDVQKPPTEEDVVVVVVAAVVVVVPNVFVFFCSVSHLSSMCTLCILHSPCPCRSPRQGDGVADGPLDQVETVAGGSGSDHTNFKVV